MSLSNGPIVISYNGVLFPPETETVEFTAKPKADGSGRTNAYIAYTITLRSIIGFNNQQAGQTTDATMADLRKRLTAPGGEFHFEGVGAGQLAVNVPPGGPTLGGAASSARDVVWGPWPRVLRWHPLGQVSAEVTWSVEVAVPECDAATYAGALMEFAFKVSVEKDRHGYSRRTYSGHLAIPQTRATVGARTLTDNADAYLERVYPALLPGFQRTPGHTTLSEDKCRLDFDVLDEEVGPNYPPEGVVLASANCTINSNQAAGIQWTWTLSATYDLARDTPRANALKAFEALRDDRLKDARVGFTILDSKEVARVTILPQARSYSEPEIYGRKQASFTVVYRMVFALRDLVKMSGLWKPVPGNDWTKWSASLANTSFNPRGNAKLKADNSIDVIVDLCSPGQNFALRAGALAAPGPRAGVLDSDTEAVDPRTSWLDYESQVNAEIDDEVYSLKPLPPAGYNLGTETLPVTAAPPPNDPFPPPGGAKIDSTTVAAPDTTAQKRATGTRYVFLKGYAVRAGYMVDEPELAGVANGTVVRACRPDRGEGVTHWKLASWFGVPIWAAKWNLRYLVTGPVGALGVPGHPY